MERAQRGWRLRLLYPMSGRFPALRSLPLPLRRLARRAATRAAVRLAQARSGQTRFVALTGAVGKTTAKDLLGAMLATTGPTVVTRENDNGIYGVPATLVCVRPGDRFAVIETGVERPGDMAWMSSLFRPELVIFTGIASDHETSFGSSAELVAEKLLLLERLGSEGVAVVNADDPRALAAVRDLPCRVVTAGRSEGADVRIESAELDWPAGLVVTLRTASGSHEVKTQLIAAHLAHPVAYAFAAAVALGIPEPVAAAAAGRVPPRAGRMQPLAGPEGSTLVLDEHKSRPLTAAAAVEALGALPAPGRIAVLGEMQETELSPAAYADLAAAVNRARCDLVVAVGRAGEQLAPELDRRIELIQAERPLDAARALAGRLGAGDVVLIHGGAHQHLQRVAFHLRSEPMRCEVRLCTLHWRCTGCPHRFTGQPPDSVIEER